MKEPAIFEAAAALSETDRMELVSRLLDTLGPETDGIDEAAFAAELERRSVEIDQGGKPKWCPGPSLRASPSDSACGMLPAVFHFHRLAAQEFRAARSWYAQRSRRTALRFVAAVDRPLSQITEAPERWPYYDWARHRWVKVKKFPYLLIYRVVTEDVLAVVAVAQAARRPGYWRRRRT